MSTSVRRNENLELKRKEIDLKAERLRLREESLKFKRDRFESWKKLMEEKGRQKENQFKVRVQLQRDKLEFRKEQFYLKRKKYVVEGSNFFTYSRALSWMIFSNESKSHVQGILETGDFPVRGVYRRQFYPLRYFAKAGKV